MQKLDELLNRLRELGASEKTIERARSEIKLANIPAQYRADVTRAFQPRRGKPGPKTPLDEPLIRAFASELLQKHIPAAANDLYSMPKRELGQRIVDFANDQGLNWRQPGDDQLINIGTAAIAEFLKRRSQLRRS
jgi:hypothetical protein